MMLSFSKSLKLFWFFTFAALLHISVIYKKQSNQIRKICFHRNLTAVTSPKKTQHQG